MSANSTGRGLRPRPEQIIGILGGLGPHAHIALERKLLTAARDLAGAVDDQDFPEWILSSVPRTPDRTAAILGRGPSPLPELLRGLRRLEGADFVIIACNSAHHFLEDLRRRSDLPLLDLIDATAAHLARRLAAGSRVGLLATTGTLRSGLYHRALMARGLEPFSPLDISEDLQEEKVMAAIYGPPGGTGLKTHGTSEAARRNLLDAADALVNALSCQALVAACTEIPLALPEATAAGVPMVDPVQVIAEVAVARVYGLSSEDG